jgi:hypothetical protein
LYYVQKKKKKKKKENPHQKAERLTKNYHFRGYRPTELPPFENWPKTTENF